MEQVETRQPKWKETTNLPSGLCILRGTRLRGVLARVPSLVGCSLRCPLFLLLLLGLLVLLVSPGNNHDWKDEIVECGGE